MQWVYGYLAAGVLWALYRHSSVLRSFHKLAFKPRPVDHIGLFLVSALIWPWWVCVLINQERREFEKSKGR